MKLVIEINENIYKKAKLNNYDNLDGVDAIISIRNGTPLPKGHWETSVDRWGEEVTTVNGYRCSECGEFNGFNDNYCPNCGADMRGDADADSC